MNVNTSAQNQAIESSTTKDNISNVNTSSTTTASKPVAISTSPGKNITLVLICILLNRL